MNYIITSAQLSEIAMIVPEGMREDLWPVFQAIQSKPCSRGVRGINLMEITPDVRRYIAQLPKGRVFYARRLRTLMHRDLGISTEGEVFIRSLSAYLQAADNIEVIREPMKGRIKVMYKVV